MSEDSSRSVVSVTPVSCEPQKAVPSYVQMAVFGANFVLLSISLFLLGIGIWLNITDKKGLDKLLGSIQLPGALSTQGVKLIGAILGFSGFLIFFISFLGCCGAAKQRSKMLILFTVLLAMCAFLELCVIVWANIARNEMEAILSTQMKRAAKKYSKNKFIKQSWDDFMQQLKCCGITQDVDPRREFRVKKMPSACCPLELQSMDVFATCAKKDMHEKPCSVAAMDIINNKIKVVNGVCICIILFQLGLTVCTIVLILQISDAHKNGIHLAHIGDDEED